VCSNIAREIRGVWHVPAFGRSLLSVNRLKACGVSHFSIPDCMHDFFVDNEEGKVWLVSKYHKGLNKPDWEIIMPSASSLNDPPKHVAAFVSAFAGLSLFHDDTAEGDAVRARVDAFARQQRDHPDRTPVFIPALNYENVTTIRSHDSPVPTASANFGSRNICCLQRICFIVAPKAGSH
jgi:hypothetical protein